MISTMGLSNGLVKAVSDPELFSLIRPKAKQTPWSSISPLLARELEGHTVRVVKNNSGFGVSSSSGFRRLYEEM